MSIERVIQHQQCPHMSLLSCLDEKRMNCHFKYSFVLLLFIKQQPKKIPFIFCWQFTWNPQQMCNFLQLSLPQLCQEDIGRQTSPWNTLFLINLCVLKKSHTNKKNKREKPEYILENSNKSTNECEHVAQQRQLHVHLTLRLQNGQLCFDFLALGSIMGQES